MTGWREGIPGDVEPAIACEQLVGVFADLQEFNEIPELRRVLRADVCSLAKKMLGSTDRRIRFFPWLTSTDHA